MKIKGMTERELAAAKRQARRFLKRDAIEHLPPCHNCNGRGWIVTGAGHFGDQMGDAGQLKAVTNECPKCCGTGKEEG